MFIIIFDFALTLSSPVSLHDFYRSLTRDQSRDMPPRLGVCVVYFLSRMQLHSGYYYYDYVTIGVLRLLLLNRNFQFEVK